MWILHVHSVPAAVRSDPMKENMLTLCLVPADTSLGGATCGVNQVVLCCGLKPDTGYIVWGPFGRKSDVNQCQILHLLVIGYLFGTTN